VTVYVETTYLLQIALQGPKPDPEAQAAEQMLSAAEAGRVRIAVPAFALAEAFSKVGYRYVDDERVWNALRAESERLRTTVFRAETRFEIRPDLRQLAARKTGETNRLLSLAARLARAGEVVPTDYSSVGEGPFISLTYQLYGLSEKDAIVLHGILSDLSRRNGEPAKCFVSRDKDFDTQQVRDALSQHGCEFRGSFKAGLQWVQDQLAGG